MTVGQALNKLARILVQLYSEEADIRRVLTNAGLNSQQISFAHKPINIWVNILEMAHKHDTVEAVTKVACEEVPAQCQNLSVALHIYQEAKKQENASSTLQLGRTTTYKTEIIIFGVKILSFTKSITTALVLIFIGAILSVTILARSNPHIFSVLHQKFEELVFIPRFNPTPVTLLQTPRPTFTSTSTPTLTPTETSSVAPEALHCLALAQGGPLPTPMVAQTQISRPENYLIPDYTPNMEKWAYSPERGWVSGLYWGASQNFIERLKLVGGNIGDYIVPDNQQPYEGNYSVCIQTPPQSAQPAEFSFLTQPLPADETLRLTFAYRTAGKPKARVVFTPDGGAAVNYVALSFALAEAWTTLDVDFQVTPSTDQKNPGCNPDLGKRWIDQNRPVGCVNLKFTVEGDGALWLDDIRVGKAP